MSRAGMQRHAAFAIPFFTSDFDTVQTTTGHDLDTLAPKRICVLHRTFHRATEHNTFFQLLRDRISDQLSVDFWLANFFDIYVHWHAHDLAQVGFQNFRYLRLFTNHNTGRLLKIVIRAFSLGVRSKCDQQTQLSIFLQIITYF